LAINTEAGILADTAAAIFVVPDKNSGQTNKKE
jgi:hypothetical protein